MKQTIKNIKKVFWNAHYRQGIIIGGFLGTIITLSFGSMVSNLIWTILLMLMVCSLSESGKENETNNNLSLL